MGIHFETALVNINPELLVCYSYDIYILDVHIQQVRGRLKSSHGFSRSFFTRVYYVNMGGGGKPQMKIEKPCDFGCGWKYWKEKNTRY